MVFVYQKQRVNDFQIVEGEGSISPCSFIKLAQLGLKRNVP